MPDLSLRLPRFLRFHRSRFNSPKLSPPSLCSDTGVIHPSDSGNCPGPSSSPSSEPALEPVSCIPSPTTVSYSTDSRNSAGRLVSDRAQESIPVGQSPQAPCLITPAAISSVGQHSNPITSLSNTIDFVQAPQHLLQPATYTPMTSSQRSLTSELPSHSVQPCFSRPQHQSAGMFNQAENFTATGNFVDGNVGYIAHNYMSSNQFMKELLEKTIPGAEFDSSDRDPPPRCHPGTRLAILERCLRFISNCEGARKIRWVVGAAGVGKSAIMQNVAESPELVVNHHASVFFSINGRNDGTKTVITLSYQFAAKSEQYRQVIEQEITRDPSLLRSSMAKQFNKLIVEPFIHTPPLDSGGRVLAIIDGLDECRDTHIQQELLRLISEFCRAHPSSPVVWLIASRPETHITAFFARRDAIPVYEKEEIPVDSDEARADVERFLWDKLAEIRDSSVSLDPQWPEERDFWKLADAAGGLFAYAYTAVRYIGDSNVGDPVSQFSEVLSVIDKHLSDVSREEHPMALLDALYARILSNISAKSLVNTRKLLLALMSNWDSHLEYSETGSNFIVLCNWLGLGRDEAYAALHHLYSVLRVRQRDKAHQEKLQPFHKSFIDYISEYTRSRFCPTEHEGRQLMAQCALRILREAPDGVNSAGVDDTLRYGILARCTGTGEKISLTWVIDDAVGWNDVEMRVALYKLAIGEVVAGIAQGKPGFLGAAHIKLVITRLNDYHSLNFPYSRLRDVVFDESRRPEFVMEGILRGAPLAIVDISEIYINLTVKLQFRRPANTAKDYSDPWDAACEHEREGEWKEDEDQDWRTKFLFGHCAQCFERLERHLQTWKTHSPNHLVSVLFTSTKQCCVEFQFVDPEDGGSEWTYWFWCEIPFEERQKHGIIVQCTT